MLLWYLSYSHIGKVNFSQKGGWLQLWYQDSIICNWVIGLVVAYIASDLDKYQTVPRINCPAIKYSLFNKFNELLQGIAAFLLAESVLSLYTDHPAY